VESLYPSLSLHESEVYMNHKFTDGREKTVLMGFRFLDERNDQMFMQDRAGCHLESLISSFPERD